MANKLRIDNTYHDVNRVEITNGRLNLDDGQGWDYIDIKLYDDESEMSDYGINAHSFRIYGLKNTTLEFTNESKELKPFALMTRCGI